MKATKNAGELQGMRACHLRDGAAESEFLAWLEEELQKLHGHGSPSTSAVSTKPQSSAGTGFGKKMNTTNSNSNTITSITEVDLDEHVTASRAALSPNGMFLEPSFPTIAG